MCDLRKLESVLPHVSNTTLFSVHNLWAEQMLRTLMAAPLFFFLLGGRWTILWITHPPFRQVAGSITNGLLCRSCVGPVVLLWVIRHWLSFSEHHQVWKVLESIVIALFILVCVVFFLNNVELLRVATCSKEHKVLVHFAVCLQDR